MIISKNGNVIQPKPKKTHQVPKGTVADKMYP